MRSRGFGRVALSAAISVAFLGVLLWRGDISDLVDALGDADWGWVVAAAVLVALSKTVHGVRWWLLVRRAGPAPLGGTVLVLLAATGVSVILPLRAGALLQLQVLRRRYGVERAAVAGTLVLELFLDAAALMVLALATAPFLHLRRSWVLGGIVAALIAGVVALTVFVLARRAGRGDLAWAPERKQRSLTAFARSLSRGFAAAGSVRYVLLLVCVTLVDWSLATTAYALAGRAFALDVPLHAYVAVEIAGNLAGVVPLTQGNLGTFEFAVTETLVAFGATRERSLAYAVAAHLAAILAVAVTGLIAAWMLGLRRQDVFYLRAHNADPAPSEPPEATVRDESTR
jgi:uncharacterized protein (TIRG00374 family)